MLHACATVEEAPDKAVLPEVPDYVKVPHPVGFEMAEIRALFENPLAPQDGLRSFTDSCDQEFQMLKRATSVKEDLRQGAQELVQLNAEKMHWCFYGKVERMQQQLKIEQTWSNRQKIVLDTYSFLTPVANAFIQVYHDSRYLRWATQYYSNISEWIFFRKVVPGPENTLALTMSASSDLESWTKQHTQQKKLSVFTRYGISMATPEMVNKEMPGSMINYSNEDIESQRAPASVPESTITEDPLDVPTQVLKSGEKPEPEAKVSRDIPKVLDPADSSPGFSAQIPETVPAPIGQPPSAAHDEVTPEKTTAPKKKAVPRKPATAPSAEAFSL